MGAMKTILLVEDQTQFAQAMLHSLEGQGYRLLHASDGSGASKLCQQTPLDLLILDWSIPALGDLEALICLRRSPPLPVLVLTAPGEDGGQIPGLEIGADDYLVKPFEMPALLERVQTLLRRVEQIRKIQQKDGEKTSQPQVYGQVILDPGRGQAVLDGEPIYLTAPEFDLLDLFLRHPGRVFSRAYLSEMVWHASSNETLVAQTVQSLRQKLGSFGEQIENCWGAGYRFKLFFDKEK